MKPEEIQYYPKNKKVVRLWNTEGVYLIILQENGVIYTNQTGGVSNVNSFEEGILLPFNNDYTIDSPEELMEFKLSILLYEGVGLSEHQADQIDAILSSCSDTKCAQVDRTKLNQSMESWVYVNINQDDECLFWGFNKAKGVLTWNNSD